MANHFTKNEIHINTHYGSIFGTTNIYQGRDTDGQDDRPEAEDIDCEDASDEQTASEQNVPAEHAASMPEPAHGASAASASESAASSMGSAELTLAEYLGQLRDLATDACKQSFPKLIERLLADPLISHWLSDTSHCRTFKAYNKSRVFRLARLLRRLGVLCYDNDYWLNQVLEKSDIDTSYRKSMTKPDQKDEEIATYICQIVKIQQ